MTQNIVYDCRWSSALDDKFIQDYIDVANAVFHGNFSRNDFHKMYLQNIYGESVIVVVYIDGTPSAARALWRNDLGGMLAYQPCNTCVLDTCRGRGIFSEMTRRAVSMLRKDAIIYNFPNVNSYHGYIRMGWKLISEYYLLLLTSNKKYREEHRYDAGPEYIDWLMKGNKNILYIKRGEAYYLVVKYPRPFCYKVLSRVTETDARKFSKLRKPAVVFYNSTRKVWYNSRFLPLRVVARTDHDIYVPSWKMDVL